MINKKKISVSIITVSLNCEISIERTLKSVLNQDYPNIEYIAIDGGSTDKTIDMINKFKDKISQIVIEKDEGIYDAMNKGIGLANGDYILFMNAGDIFYNNSVISDILKGVNKEYVLIMGDTIYKYPNNFKRKLKASVRIFELPTSHQSTFYKREVFDTIGLFDIKYKICADLDLWQKIYIKYRDDVLIENMPVSIYSLDGLSSSNWFSPCLERLLVSKKNLSIYFLLPTYLNFFLDVIKFTIISSLKFTGIYYLLVSIKHKHHKTTE